MNNRIFLFCCICLISFTGCNKNKEKNNLQNIELLKGNWELINSEVSVESNDDESSLKIASAMDAEMSVLKTSLFFQDNSLFTVKSKLDTIELKKNGKYTIEDENLTFSFIGADESTISFTYKFAVNQDSLYIIFDNLEEIQQILNDKTYSDANLRLMYGIKDRNNIELKSAQVKRIYSRFKDEDQVKNDSIAVNDSIKSSSSLIVPNNLAQ